MRKRLAGTPSRPRNWFPFLSVAKAACPSTFINFLSQKYRSQWLMSICNSFMNIVLGRRLLSLSLWCSVVFGASKWKKNICVKVIKVKSTIKNFHYISWFSFCSLLLTQTQTQHTVVSVLVNRSPSNIAACSADVVAAAVVTYNFNVSQNEANPTHIHRWHSRTQSPRHVFATSVCDAVYRSILYRICLVYGYCSTMYIVYTHIERDRDLSTHCSSMEECLLAPRNRSLARPIAGRKMQKWKKHTHTQITYGTLVSWLIRSFVRSFVRFFLSLLSTDKMWTKQFESS